jgi:carbonic anhydrase/acetyltransferase-like protein (isoleucine patch superfamily)
MLRIDDFYIAANAIVLGDVVIGAGANIWYGCIIRGDLARITLAARVNLQDGCIMHTDHDRPQLLEEGVVVGHGAILHGSRIGRDTLIGIGARILSGCDIGQECLIAAGTVMPENRRIPPRSVVMGIPAKVMRAITEDEIAKTRRINAHYAELAQRHAANEFRSLNRQLNEHQGPSPSTGP